MRWSIALVTGLFLTVMQCPTYGVFATVLLLIIIPAAIPRPTRYAQRRAVWMLLATSLAAGAVMFCSYLLQSWFVNHDQFIAGVSAQRSSLSVGPFARSLQVADLPRLFDPSVVKVQEPSLMDDELHSLMYLGWVPVVAALLGMACAWRRRQRWLLVVVGIGILFGLLSFGPSITIDEQTLPNPFYIGVAWLVPVYGTTEAVWQQNGVLVGLGACGIAAFVAAVPWRWVRIGLAVALVAGTLVERALVLPLSAPVLTSAPARLSSIYDAAYGDGGLVEFPRIRPDQMLSRGIVVLAQARHHRPIPAAINLGMSRWDKYLPIMVGSAADWTQSAACLRDGGFRWAVVHRDWFGNDEEADEAIQGLRDAAGAPVAEEGDALLFDLAMVTVDRSLVDTSCPVEE